MPILLGRAGERIVLDAENEVYFDILFPDRDVEKWSRNDGSIVGRLVYGETSYMLMGDSTEKTEAALLAAYPAEILESDVLKLGHHGSKTSSSKPWLEAVAPAHAMISAGCNNSYGHPHQEVTDRLDTLKIEHFVTCENGNIEIDSDGKTIRKM